MTTSNMAWPPHFTLKKHPRAKHVKLKSSIKHGLELIVPPRFNQREIPAILEANRAWIEKKLLELQTQKSQNPVTLPNDIHLHAVQQHWSVTYIQSSNKLQLLTRPHQNLVLFGDIQNESLCRKLLTLWLRKHAESVLVEQLQLISKTIHLPYRKAIIRDQSSRWGSCSSDKSISLNYKLLFLPTHLMRHIIIHELCHTVHLNHSEKFWQLVATFDVDWKAHRKILKEADRFIPGWTHD